MTRKDETIAELEGMVELLSEASIDAQRLLAAEDIGWARVGADGQPVIDREAIVKVGSMGAIAAIADPLIKRAVNLRIAYLGSPDIAAEQEDSAQQDVNAVVQAFLDDPSNAEVIGSSQAAQERERTRLTKGNTFHALVTAPRTGRVQIRLISMDEIADIITDPEDINSPWFYKRQWTSRVVEQGYSGLTRTRTETRRAYYPDVNYRPVSRPRTIDGIVVQWDTPIVHTAPNRPERVRWGVPDVLAALPWARGYKDFLEDWARLHKALATVAFRATAKTRGGAAQARARIPAGDGTVGRTVIQPEGTSFEAVNKSGATFDAGSGKPLAGMVAAGTDVPITMLLADPGITGARATAETLDQPLYLATEARRELDKSFLTTVLNYVVRESVRAPQGDLKGSVLRDEFTGRETVTLTGDQEISFTIEYPKLDEESIAVTMAALTAARDMDLVPPLTIARLVLLALEVDNVDEVLKQVTTDNGQHMAPSELARTTSALNGVGALDQGNQPQDTPPPPTTPPPAG